MIVLDFGAVEVEDLLGTNLGLFNHHGIGQGIDYHNNFGPAIGKTAQAIVHRLCVVAMNDRNKSIVGRKLGEKYLARDDGTPSRGLGVPKNQVSLYRSGPDQGRFTRTNRVTHHHW